ncbi:7-carboxy-7-deazaguanine synthase QueE [Thermococcus barophilus]|uniref:7-carboxy-7-deazaguanine synthase n=1 Tax=Thermococcus barophilus TaxID=55802 RepID=A0A0S1XAD7_THEBA|nr:7-carboxy-7-deazaguanine synthase QueE [Thermococcus barophilus]ALM74727.1 7-carboxy-7-deazaguanine synthase [Thermococcus barophilus]
MSYRLILAEIFNSWQGEGGSVEGSAFGRRQIFVRFAGCDLRCVWCDSRQFIDASKVLQWRYEIEPFSGEFKYKPNPATLDEVVDVILSLDTGDVHSISYTGGEPTLQIKPLKSLMEKSSELGFKNFLETHGGFPERIAEIAHLVDYASVDIKDESARATGAWRDLVMMEVESIKILRKAGAKVYAKLVVTKDTKLENLEWYASLLEGSAPLVIQPKEPIDLTQKQLMEFYKAAAKILGRENVGLSFQVHKYLNVL